MSVWFGLALSCFSLLVTSTDALAISGLQRIKATGKMIVGMNGQDNPPFVMQDASGELYGLDIDIARDIARHLNVKVIFDRSSNTFDGVVSKVANGEVDVAISKLSRTLSRAELVRFSDPYITLRLTLMINRLNAVGIDEKRRGDPSSYDREGAIVGVQEGSSFVGYAQRDFSKAKIRTYATKLELFKAVRDGKITLALVDESVAKYFRDRYPRSAVHVRVEFASDKDDALAFAVNTTNEHLLAWLNLYVENSHRSGYLKAVAEEYLEQTKWQKRLGQLPKETHFINEDLQAGQVRAGGYR